MRSGIAESNLTWDLLSTCFLFNIEGKWQDLRATVSRRADLSSFCLEVTKKPGIAHLQGPLPVHLYQIPAASQQENQNGNEGDKERI